MIRLLYIITAFATLLNAQELIRHFGLDKRNAYEYSAKYTFDTYPDETPQQVLILKNIRGDITVSGSIDPKVSIEEKITIYSKNKREAEKIVEQAMARVQAVNNNSVISLSGTKAMFDADLEYSYKIRHPKNVSIQVDALGGDIELENITGEVKLESIGGNLRFDRVTGKINCRTAGGDIDVIDSEGSFTVVTMGGNVEVFGSNGKVFASTSGGDMTVEAYKGNIELESLGGTIHLKRIDGNEVRTFTKGGDIEVESVKGNIVLKTQGGNIEIIDLSGNVKAETSAGDIEMLQITGEASAATNSGDIDLMGMYGPVTASSYRGDIQVQKLVRESLRTEKELQRLALKAKKVEHNLDLYAKYGDISVKLPKELTIQLDAVVKDGDTKSPSINASFPVEIIENMDETIGQALRGVDSLRYLIKLKSSHGKITIEDI